MSALLMSALTANLAHQTITVATKVCPKAPPQATQPVNEIEGYVLWGVILLFGIAVIVGLGAVLAGRVFAMPHASKVGVISIVVVFICAVAYLVLPGMVDGILGSGCI
jgi:hypothetical protein